MQIPEPEQNVSDLCDVFIAEQWNGNTSHISPTSVALGLLGKFPKHEGGDVTVNYHAFIRFKEIARAKLRFCFKQEEEQVEQLDMFGRQLQTRYPTRDQYGETYTRLDDLEDDDLLAQIDRLEKESRAKARHALALRAYRAQRRLSGGGKAA